MRDPLHRLALRNIRIVATLYLLVLIVATHWPKLRIVAGDAPIDKLMHFAGFGLAAVAVYLAQWCVRWWVLLVVMLAFTLLDEITQSTLSYGRVFSFADIVAGWLGVVVVVALVHGFRPVGGRQARKRRQLWIDGAASLLARPAPWMIICMSGALGAMVGGVLLITLDSIYPRPHPNRAMLMGALVGGLGLAHWTFEVGLRRELRLIRSERRCGGCGAGQDPKDHPSDGMVCCSSCERRTPSIDWELPTSLSQGLLIHAIFRPLLIAGICLLVLVAGWGSLLGVRDQPLIIDFEVWWRQLGYESQGVVDLTVGGLLVAGVISAFRGRLARAVDRQDVRCLACGQDLNGVPSHDGHGRCPECGERFSESESDVCSST